jgi:protein-S-isoprenylcysteine O-methyltransferase Ste14
METTGQPIVASDLSLRIKNFAASAAVAVLAAAVFAFLPNNREAMTELRGPPEFVFTGFQFMATAVGVYVLLLGCYFLSGGATGLAKSLRFMLIVRDFFKAPVQSWKRGLEGPDRVAFLSTLLKGFFGPMMVNSLMIFCVSAWMNGNSILDSDWSGLGFLGWFDRVGYWFLLQVILFVDVFFFTVGYLVESRRLGNEIRSVDPTLIGWTAALVCYPPFNLVTSRLLGGTVSDFPEFDDPTMHLALNLALLTLMAIYASASAALGLKASNLTHRGIISRGPYAVIRHPAYICKNMAWWIGSVPLIITAFEHSAFEGLRAAGSMAAWSGVYALRALTEEDHLRRVDGAYAEYAAKVRYRFIPGLI